MAKTYLQKSESYLDRIIKEGKNSPHALEYQKVCKSLERLVKITNKLTDRNHKMTSEEFQKLTKGYANVQKACQEYLSKADQFDEYEKNRKGIISEISSVLNKDIRVLGSTDSLNPGTLSEIIDKSRTYKVVLDSKDFRKIGANLSSRIPIRTNKGTKGFFTPTSVYNLDPEWEKALEKVEERFSSVSEQIKEKVNLLKTNDALQYEFSSWIQDEPISEEMMYAPQTQKRMAKLASLLGMGNDSKEVRATFKNNQELYTALFEFSNSIVDLANKQVVIDDTGIKKGANISSRNCAMTNMAKLLGCGDLLAKSVHMKVEIDGEEIEGVFMETAEGSDLNRVQEDDLILDADGKSFENPDALMKIVDLQVLDFICGNTDRHMGNMVYQFKETSKGVVFTGVKGIDNDCSFGTPQIVPGDPIMRMVNPESMKLISEKMLKKLNDITPEMVQTALANDNLSQDEMNAAFDRITKVKEAVNFKLIQPINRKYWAKNDLYKHKLDENYFTRIYSIQASCSMGGYSRDIDNSSKVEYAQEVTNANHIMSTKDAAIRALREKLDNPKAKALFFNSSEYNMMEKRFLKIEKLTKELKENYTDMKKVPEELTNDLRTAYIELAEKTDRYIELKKLVPSSVNGQLRLEFARGLKEFADETLKDLGIYFERQTDKEVVKETKETKENEVEPIFEENDPILEEDDANLVM